MNASYGSGVNREHIDSGDSSALNLSLITSNSAFSTRLSNSRPSSGGSSDSSTSSWSSGTRFPLVPSAAFSSRSKFGRKLEDDDGDFVG